MFDSTCREVQDRKDCVRRDEGNRSPPMDTPASAAAAASTSADEASVMMRGVTLMMHIAADAMTSQHVDESRASCRSLVLPDPSYDLRSRPSGRRVHATISRVRVAHIFFLINNRDIPLAQPLW